MVGLTNLYQKHCTEYRHLCTGKFISHAHLKISFNNDIIQILIFRKFKIYLKAVFQIL